MEWKIDKLIVRDAKPKDWLYINYLRGKEWNALGFIPKNCYLSVLERFPLDGRRRWIYSRLLVTEEDGVLTGFTYASFANGVARIFQIAVQEDARRLRRASLMVGEIEREATRRQCQAVRVRVAADLEANDFWKALGYVPIKVIASSWRGRDSARGRLLIIYVKGFAPLFALEEDGYLTGK